ncbi:MAG: hypothetical protein H7Z11_02900 [Verrucomicrobia bacterium]|nr:hypothetical protein [Leptolyngbya sp. ES-bin-22]
MRGLTAVSPHFQCRAGQAIAERFVGQPGRLLSIAQPNPSGLTRDRSWASSQRASETEQSLSARTRRQLLFTFGGASNRQQQRMGLLKGEPGALTIG